MKDTLKNTPVLPLRGTCVLPQASMPLFVTRLGSMAAVNLATASPGRTIVCVPQKNHESADVGPDDLCDVGTLCLISGVSGTPVAECRLVVIGTKRLERITYERRGNIMLVASADVAEDIPAQDAPETLAGVAAAISEQVLRLANADDKTAEQVVQTAHACAGKPTQEIIRTLAAKAWGWIWSRPEDAGKGAAWMDPRALLSENDPGKRLEAISRILGAMLLWTGKREELMRLEDEKLDEAQRAYAIKERIRILESMLPKSESEGAADTLGARFSSVKEHMPPETAEKVRVELARLSSIPHASPERHMLAGWVEAAVSLPWGKTTRPAAPSATDQSMRLTLHGLDKARRRIVDILAARELGGPKAACAILLVGPPGVGKTSFAHAFAKAAGLEFIVAPLGGTRDEAEVRGHRRTYVGSMPGRIIQGLARSSTMNPVMLLDEIDKTGGEGGRDISAALLEVLDPQQNSIFRDRYLDFGVDLSRVFFIATANSMNGISAPLLDRLEVIELPGYLPDEKLEMAKSLIVPKLICEHGLPKGQLVIGDDVLATIIAEHTREAGVRELSRLIAILCRKAAARILDKNTRPLTVKSKDLEALFDDVARPARKVTALPPGTARGLAWTARGGETLEIEVLCVPGTGKTELTGRLGDVMKESALTARSWVRATLAAKHGKDVLGSLDMHVHAPEGAVPKDGPSAGIVLAAAMLSAAENKPLADDVAMTGEISLAGRVLPVGGLREKLCAAATSGVKRVAVPAENMGDVAGVPDWIKKALTIVPVATGEQAMDFAFGRNRTKKGRRGVNAS